MFGRNIIFKNFNSNKPILNKKKRIRDIFNKFLKEKNQVLNSLKKDYKNVFELD